MSECAWCGDEITEKAVRFKNLNFCSGDCRDEWEEDMEAGEDGDLEDDEFEDELIDDDEDEGDDVKDDDEAESY